MRRLLAFGLAAAAAFGLVRLLGRGRAVEALAPPESYDSRAEELRRKLAESRSLVGEREQFEAGETPVDAAEPMPVDPDARRRSVHEQGRSVVEQMHDRTDA